jgi:hypothetical protein
MKLYHLFSIVSYYRIVLSKIIDTTRQGHLKQVGLPWQSPVLLEKEMLERVFKVLLCDFYQHFFDVIRLVVNFVIASHTSVVFIRCAANRAPGHSRRVLKSRLACRGNLVQ